MPDLELSFDGAAAPEVIMAWRRRFERMGLLREVCGAEWSDVRDEFLGCLGRADHVSTARVVACVGVKD